MKRILLSLITIGIVSAGVFGATKAFFTDTEKSVGNTFSAGTIDIAVDNENPWSRSTPYQFMDMKPSQTEYANFIIKNVGTNPANVWKKIENIVTNEGVMTEPECAEYGGTWVDYGDHCSGGWEGHDIHNYIDYDLSVEVWNAGNVKIWWQTIYNKNVTISQTAGTNIYLGMIPVGWSMKVTQSYHMKESVTNWAQGDKMTFDITLTAEQLKGIAVLEDKTGEPDWRIKTETPIQGTLTYGVKDSKFNFSFAGKGLLPTTDYSLIVYEEPWSIPNSGVVWPRPVIVLGSATSDGSGNVVIPNTSLELGQSLLNTKIWLVKTGDLAGATISGWNPADYLFDTGLIDYYDSDL